MIHKQVKLTIQILSITQILATWRWNTRLLYQWQQAIRLYLNHVLWT